MRAIYSRRRGLVLSEKAAAVMATAQHAMGGQLSATFSGAEMRVALGQLDWRFDETEHGFSLHLRDANVHLGNLTTTEASYLSDDGRRLVRSMEFEHPFEGPAPGTGSRIESGDELCQGLNLLVQRLFQIRGGKSSMRTIDLSEPLTALPIPDQWLTGRWRGSTHMTLSEAREAWATFVAQNPLAAYDTAPTP